MRSYKIIASDLRSFRDSLEQHLSDLAATVDAPIAKPTSLIVPVSIPIDGQVVRLEVRISELFPSKAPEVMLIPPDALGVAPHVDAAGKICFGHEPGLLFDAHQPDLVVADAVQRAIDILIRRQLLLPELLAEFGSYWSGQPGCHSIRTLLTADDRPRIVAAHVEGRSRRIRVITEAGAPPSWLGALHPGLVSETALYFPLPVGSAPYPPSNGASWSPAEFQSCFDMRIRPALKDEDRLFAKVKRKNTTHMVFSIQLQGRPRVLFGASFGGLELHAHPAAFESATAIRPFACRRVDREFLIQRGGSDPRLGKLRAGIIGLGAIGGYAAAQLARAGIGNLRLIDEDTLEAENVFRHDLGLTSVGSPKVKAVSARLQADLPGLQIESRSKPWETVAMKEPEFLLECDAILCLTGSPNANLEFNAWMREQSRRRPVVFGWLEPLGIGGHAKLVRGGRGGCLECVYTIPEIGSTGVTDRSAFAEPGQEFQRALDGCSGSFSPFGSFDAIRSAELAARLTVMSLTGSEPDSPLLSWKGNAGQLRAAGYRVTRRFDLSSEQLYEHRYSFATSGCRVCAGGQ